MENLGRKDDGLASKSWKFRGGNIKGLHLMTGELKEERQRAGSEQTELRPGKEERRRVEDAIDKRGNIRLGDTVG